jgi:hypothetical protein
MQGTVVVQSSVGGGGVPGTDTLTPDAPRSDGGLGGLALLLGTAAGAVAGLSLLRRRVRAG